MKKRLLVLVFLILAGLLFSCGTDKPGTTATADSESQAVTTDSNADASETSEATEAVYHKISAKEAKDMMDKNSSYIILDVRTESEYKDRHIPNAVLIPNTEIKDRAETELPDKNALIFVYCRSGVRAAGAANDLVNMGYTKVYDMGGIIDWTYDTVSG